MRLDDRLHQLEHQTDGASDTALDPVGYLLLTLLELHPDHAALLANMEEANRQGKRPTNPLVRAVAQVAAGAVALRDLGLYDSALGEELCQFTDCMVDLITLRAGGEVAPNVAK